jgi:SAM-dependent methyltransferase
MAVQERAGAAGAASARGKDLPNHLKKCVLETIQKQHDQASRVYIGDPAFSGLPPALTFEFQYYRFYTLRALSEFDDDLIAHACVGGDVAPGLKGIYLSPKRLAKIALLRPEHQEQLWRHELYHLDHPEQSEEEVRREFPLDAVQAELQAIEEAQKTAGPSPGMRPLEYKQPLRHRDIVNRTHPHSYPIYAVGRGRLVIKKHNAALGHGRRKGRDVESSDSLTDNHYPLNARFLYEIAHVLGYTNVNPVQIDLTTPGFLSAVEDHFGDSLYDRYNNSEVLDLEYALDVINNGTHDPEKRLDSYTGLVKKFGPAFVEMDLFRLFALYSQDSHDPNHFRFSQLGGKPVLTLIDYNNSFTDFLWKREQEYQLMRGYLWRHKEIYHQHAFRLLSAIADPRTEKMIEEMGEKIFGQEMFNRLSGAIRAADSGPSAQEKIERLRTLLESDKAFFVEGAKRRRLLIKDLYDEIVTGKQVGGPGNTVSPPRNTGSAAAALALNPPGLAAADVYSHPLRPILSNALLKSTGRTFPPMAIEELLLPWHLNQEQARNVLNRYGILQAGQDENLLRTTIVEITNQTKATLRTRNQSVLDGLVSFPGVKVVEMGSQYDDFIKEYREKHPKEMIIGFEPFNVHLYVLPPAIVVQDAGDSGIPSSSVDKVIINMPSPRTINRLLPHLLEEAFRILKPGGVIEISFENATPNNPNLPYFTNPPGINIAAMLKLAGFDEIRERPLPADYPPSHYIKNYLRMNIGCRLFSSVKNTASKLTTSETKPAAATALRPLERLIRKVGWTLEDYFLNIPRGRITSQMERDRAGEFDDLLGRLDRGRATLGLDWASTVGDLRRRLTENTRLMPNLRQQAVQESLRHLGFYPQAIIYLFLAVVGGVSVFHLAHNWILIAPLTLLFFFAAAFPVYYVFFSGTYPRMVRGEVDESDHLLINPFSWRTAPETIAHEAVHVLARWRIVACDLPTARAYDQLEHVRRAGRMCRAFREGAELFKNYPDPRERWDRIASQGWARYAEGDRAKLFRRSGDQELIGRPEGDNPTEPAATHRVGDLMAGIAQGISEATGRPEDAFAYWALIALGLDPVEAERRILAQPVAEATNASSAAVPKGKTKPTDLFVRGLYALVNKVAWFILGTRAVLATLIGRPFGISGFHGFSTAVWRSPMLLADLAEEVTFKARRWTVIAEEYIFRALGPLGLGIGAGAWAGTSAQSLALGAAIAAAVWAFTFWVSPWIFAFAHWGETFRSGWGTRVRAGKDLRNLWLGRRGGEAVAWHFFDNALFRQEALPADLSEFMRAHAAERPSWLGEDPLSGEKPAEPGPDQVDEAVQSSAIPDGQGKYSRFLLGHWITLYTLLFDAQSGLKVLDLGTGNYPTLLIGKTVARFLRAKGLLIGLDLAEAVKPPDGILAIQGMMEILPLRSKSIDVVTATRALEVSYVKGTLQEVWRVLKDDGRAFFLINHEDTFERRQAIQDFYELIAAEQTGLLARAKASLSFARGPALLELLAVPYRRCQKIAAQRDLKLSNEPGAAQVMLEAVAIAAGLANQAGREYMALDLLQKALDLLQKVEDELAQKKLEWRREVAVAKAFSDSRSGSFRALLENLGFAIDLLVKRVVGDGDIYWDVRLHKAA